MEIIQEREGAHEQLQAQAHVWNHIFSFISSMSLKCAVQLGIPDIIHNHGQPMTLSELVESLPVTRARASHVHRLMRLLVHSGFFALQKNGNGDDVYVLTASSRLLLKESRTSLSPFLLLMLDQMVMSPWHFLTKWFQGDEETATKTALGVGLWEFMAQNTETSNMFNVAMASDSRILMGCLVNECGGVFQGVGSLVDVGGGTGESAMTIARAFPHIKCTVLDLPHVVATVPKTTGLDFVGGDMFQSIPKADAVFLKWILHDWSDEDCVKILRQCKVAIPSSKEEGGKVIIVDIVVDTAHNNNPKATETKLYADLLMMVHTGGKERDESQWLKIFMDAGFNQYKITPALGLRSVIELYP